MNLEFDKGTLQSDADLLSSRQRLTSEQLVGSSGRVLHLTLVSDAQDDFSFSNFAVLLQTIARL